MKTLKWIFYKLLAVIKGAIIGLAVVIPGVSGGSMIMTFGIYERALDITCADRKRRNSAILFLLPYVLGIVVGVLLLAGVIEWMFTRFPLQTILLFTGLILGSLPMLFGHVKGRRASFFSILWLVLMIALLIVLPYLSSGATRDAHLELSLTGCLLSALLGFIAAGTMIVPGVSGSMVMLVMGYYHDLLRLVDGVKNALLAGDFGLMLHNALPLIPFGVGVIAGILAVTKLLRWLLARHEVTTYYAIIGLMAASPFAIFVKSWDEGVLTAGSLTAVNFLTGAVCLAAGFFFAWWMDRQEQRRAQAPAGQQVPSTQQKEAPAGQQAPSEQPNKAPAGQADVHADDEAQS